MQIAVPLPSESDPHARALVSEAVRTRFALSSFRWNADDERKERVAERLRGVRESAQAAGLEVLARVIERFETLLREDAPLADARFLAVDELLGDIAYRKTSARIPEWASEHQPAAGSPLELVLRATEGIARDAAEHVDALVQALTCDPPEVAEPIHDTEVDAPVDLVVDWLSRVEAASYDVLVTEPIDLSFAERTEPVASPPAPLELTPPPRPVASFSLSPPPLPVAPLAVFPMEAPPVPMAADRPATWSAPFAHVRETPPERSALDRPRRSFWMHALIALVLAITGLLAGIGTRVLTDGASSTVTDVR